MGWKTASKSVGGPKNLAKLGFNNNPMEFLNLFNDLDVVQSEEASYWVLYRYEKGNNLMIYDREDDDVSVSNDVIWLFLKEGFKVNLYKRQEVMGEWLDKVYNLKGVMTYGYDDANVI